MTSSDDIGHGAKRLRKETIDKDLRKLEQMEVATRSLGRDLVSTGMAVVFLSVIAAFAAFTFGSQPGAVILIVAAVLAGYMALNIGANDVANNVGPAVGSRAMTMMGALVIAAIFESAGALIAGGDVVKTISKGIIDPAQVSDSSDFIAAMMAALCASAVWVNLATYIGAPVSTTHAVVGGVVGAGISAVGFGVVDWNVMAAIAASWVISPFLGGIIAALFLAFIKSNIIYQDDKIAAARLWVPALVAIMCSAFTAYLLMKGFKHLWKPSSTTVLVISLAVLVAAFVGLKPVIVRQSANMENRNQSLRKLFHIPLICSAALLSFAHGANDVANAIGPLAGILHALETGDIAGKVKIPFWVMLIGAAGISLGLFLFGPKLIRMVGENITKMNPIRAYCVALSAAITVIVASALGLPVSSTHIAVGAVFGVGFFREYYSTHSRVRREYLARKGVTVAPDEDVKREPAELIRRKLVRRKHFTVVVAAWLITVPAAGLISAILYRMIRAMM